MEKLYEFLAALSKNNNREWFNDHKEEFLELREGFTFMVDQLIYVISQFDPEILGIQAKDCLFRIYRDVRFSHDKTPYQTHISAWIVKGGKKSEYPGYYIHVQPGNTYFAAGIWNPSKELRHKIREDIVSNTEEYLEVLEDTHFKRTFDKMMGEKLKRCPKGFDPNFEHLELLLHQDFIMQHDVKDDFFTKHWLEKAGRIFEESFRIQRLFYPLVDELLDQ